MKIVSVFLVFLAAVGSVSAHEPPQQPSQHPDLSSMSIEDLMAVKVVSVSKTEQKLSRTASAVFVIAPEDIRRSGATNIPDLLRMAPGVDVAQITANTWAVGVRGFNGRFSNKLLVLLDGRSVYTGTTAGVFWDVLNLPLEDIERIEIIRGPGGSIWGANAVDGVINIITKKAGETPGGMIEAGGGNLDKGFGTVQYGGRLGKSIDYRAYAQYLNQSPMPNASGQNGGDSWHLGNSGFRTDSVLSNKDTLMVQGNLYSGSEFIPAVLLPSITSPAPQFTDNSSHLSGGFIQSVWNHVYSPRMDATLKVSYDAYRRDDALREARKNVNADFQHHILWGNRQDLLWGLDLRYSLSDSGGSTFVFLNPPSHNDFLFGAFVQDEIVLVPDRLYLTAGLRMEDSPYTGWAAMPSARVAWRPIEHHMGWAAISRSIRTPDETDNSIRVNFVGFPGPGGIPAVAGLAGNPDFQNEELLAYEMGYRATISDRASVDVTAYYNDFKNLQTQEPGAPFLESAPAPLHLVIPLVYGNLMHGEAHGFEISTNLKLNRRWVLKPGYAFETIHMHLAATSQDTTAVSVAEGSNPNHSAQLRSHVDLPHGLGWDMSAYFVDRLASGNIPSYTRMDTQLSWKWSETGSFSVVGQNLLQDHHPEFQDSTQSILTNQMKRSFYAKVNWRF